MREREALSERGTGIIASVFGVVIFLVFMLLAVQVAFVLYARSSIQAAAYDAARVVSGSDAATNGLAAAETAADSRLQASLGGYAARSTVIWDVTKNQVGLTVSLRTPSLLPAALMAPLGMDSITKTVMLRREYVR